MWNGLNRLFLGIMTATGLLFAAPGHAREIVLTPANSLVLRGEVANDNMNRLINSIMASKENKLYLYIDSFGGSILAGLKLIEAIKATDKTIVCIANTAISMAFVILQGCDKRLIVDDAILMQHVAAYSIEGQEPNNLSFAGFLHRMVKDLYKRQAERIGLSEEEFYKKIRDDWWLWDDEAIQANTADGKVNIKCTPELVKQIVTESVQVFIFSMKVKFSACPLIPGPIAISELPEEAKKNPMIGVEMLKVLEQYNPRAFVDRRFHTKRLNFEMLRP